MTEKLSALVALRTQNAGLESQLAELKRTYNQLFDECKRMESQLETAKLNQMAPDCVWEVHYNDYEGSLFYQATCRPSYKKVHGERFKFCPDCGGEVK